jgi:hypothetical protein
MQESREPQLSNDDPSKPESGRDLVYVEEFKQLIREHPGIIKSFLKLDKEIKERKDSGKLSIGDTFRDGYLSITIIDKLGKDKKSNPKVIRAYYMKVEIGNETFFIKSIPGYQHNEGMSGGAKEFVSLEETKRLLEGISGVEVIDFQLGYEHKNGYGLGYEYTDDDRTYFVSKWRNGTRLDMYLFDLKEKIFLDQDSESKYKNLLKRVEEIKTKLGDKFLEINTANMLYDKEADKIIVYDTHLEK